jgi:hypothetical protein
MKGKNMNKTGVLKLLPIFLLAAAITLTAASCGSGTSSSSSAQTSTKLPPGATTETQSDSTNSSETQTAQQTDQSQSTASQSTTSSATNTTTQTTTTPQAAADLSGARFTVVAATRPSSNKVVSSSSDRQENGDYLQVELTIENVDDALVDLSNYSFRLYSPGITASQYEDYYGTTGTYGAYVSKHVISAALLDVSTLGSVSYKMRIGEKLEDVFLFFDLNPQSTAKNASVTKDDTNLIIYDTDTGEKVEISLAGYADE